MNHIGTFINIKGENPYGKEDEYLKIEIDNTSSTYRLSNLITQIDTYTFSIWAKANSNCNVTFNILGTSIVEPLTTDWKKVTRTVTVSDLNFPHIDITPDKNTVTYYYEGYLVKGAIDTSWNPAPEDTEASLATLASNIAKLEITADGIRQMVESNYITKDDAGNLVNSSMTSVIEQTAEMIESSVTNNITGENSYVNQKFNSINQTVTDLSGNVSDIEQTLDGITQRVTDAEGNISSLEQTSQNLQTQIENAQGDISNIQQTATSLQSQITNNKNDISQLEQDVEGFKTTVSSQLGALETNIEQTAEDIELSVSEVADNLKNNYYNKTQTDALIKVEADKITSTVSRVESVETTLKKTIKNTVEEFYLSTSHTALSGGSWSTTQPTWTDGKYIWRRTKVTYTDDTTGYTPSTNGVCITGNTGPKGDDGAPVTVKSTVTDYQASSSGTVIPTGSWSTTIPTVSAGQYLWTRVRVTYSDDKVATSYSVARQGQNGQNGDDGKGIKSTSITYQAHSSQTSVPTGSWSSSVPTLSTDKPYLWTRTIITYTDDTTSTSYSVGSTLDSFEIGGRNLLLGSDIELTATGTGSPANFSYIKPKTFYINIEELQKKVGQSIVSSVYVKIENAIFNTSDTVKNHRIGWEASLADPDDDRQYIGAWYSVPISDEPINFEGRIDRTQLYSDSTHTVDKATGLYIQGLVSGTVTISRPKLEVGNKPTDWSPAPEDVQEGIDNAQTSADNAQSVADSTESRVTVAESTIQQLSDAISTLVVDENGESMMTQTSEGWRFDMGSINSQLNDAKDQLNNLAGTVNQVDETIGNLNDLANDLSEKTAYITMTTDDNGDPCIELGKSDNDFKVRITNTSIDFMEGSSKIAYLSNSSLYIERAVIKNELQIGEETGYIWKKRSNNHMGLRWLGG